MISEIMTFETQSLRKEKKIATKLNDISLPNIGQNTDCQKDRNTIDNDPSNKKKHT